MGGVDLSTALAQNAPKVHTLGLDSVLQLMIKLLGDGSRAHEIEGQHMSTAMVCTYSKVGSIVALYRKSTRALIFEHFSHIVHLQGH